MKTTFQYTAAAILLLGSFQKITAQKTNENIGTEVVNVVKPYTPTISDAFKVKETPTLDDEETAKKENIQYNIFSFPVASTFTPAKGKAANVDKSPAEKIFSNYVTLAAGNFGTVNAELFVTQNVSNTDYFGGMLRHLSSAGGVKDAELDDKYLNTSLDLTYGSRTRALSWNADAGYKHQIYNWYGIFPNTLDQATVDAINPQQTYHTLYLGGRLSLGDSFFKESSIKFSRFWDAYGSAENRFIAKPSLEFDIVEQKIKADFVLDYLSGSFDKSYAAGTSFNYGFTNFGFQPSIKIKKDDLSVNAGVGFFYSAAKQGDSKFFIYPQVTGSYKVVGDLMIFYAGIEGALKQNSYSDYVQENFFVSPTLAVAPTDQKYDVYVGLKGKLANSISYNVRGSYLNEENKPLFKSNGYEEGVGSEAYYFGNSFDVVYDNVKTISFFGELKADFSKNVSFGINGTFSSYNTDVQDEAWNLPSIKIGSNLDFNITPKWYAGTSLFFVGERKDFAHFASLSNPLLSDETVTLKSYFDLNAHVGYKYSERLTFFLKGNNLANQDYQRWLNYPVQGLQIMGGASYKFDF